jgi:hypothetical protein
MSLLPRCIGRDESLFLRPEGTEQTSRETPRSQFVEYGKLCASEIPANNESVFEV